MIIDLRFKNIKKQWKKKGQAKPGEPVEFMTWDMIPR